MFVSSLFVVCMHCVRVCACLCLGELIYLFGLFLRVYLLLYKCTCQKACFGGYGCSGRKAPSLKMLTFFFVVVVFVVLDVVVVFFLVLPILHFGL